MKYNKNNIMKYNKNMKFNKILMYLEKFKLIINYIKLKIFQ